MNLTWLSDTQTDCFIEISELAQVTQDMFNKERSKFMRELNWAVRYAKNDKITSKVPALQPNCFRVLGFSESSLRITQTTLLNLDTFVF